MTATLPLPLMHEITPAVMPVPDGRRTVECRLDATGISWGDRHVPYDHIASVAYSCRRRPLNLVQRRVERRLVLQARSGTLEIVMGRRAFGVDHDELHGAVYQAILSTLHHVVEPRLRSAMLRSMAADEVIRIGPLELDHSGLRLAGADRRIEWRQLPTAQLEQGKVVLRATIEHPSSALARIDMLVPNAPLLPELLDEAAVTFS